MSAPISAEKPDAGPSRFKRFAVATVHATILAGLLAFLAWYLVVGPVWAYLQRPRELARVRLVARSLVEVRAATDGEFVSVRAMPNGTVVKTGQVLGRLQSANLEAELATETRKLKSLQLRQLILGERMAVVEDQELRPDLDREYREASYRLIEVEQNLERLKKIENGLMVRSPVDGQIHFGLGASKAVQKNDSLAFIWPAGGELLFEVDAPLSVINTIIVRNRASAIFETPSGPVVVQAVPITGSLRPFTQGEHSEKNDVWGLLQCVPDGVPEAVRYPGALGRLQ